MKRLTTVTFMMRHTWARKDDGVLLVTCAAKGREDCRDSESKSHASQ